MKISRAERELGEVIQTLDFCAACNPDYIVRNADGEDLLRIAVLDGGFFCGIFGVRKFMIISGDNQTVVGEIVNETSRANSRRKLIADEQRPLIKIRIAMYDDLDTQSKALIIAAAFTVVRAIILLTFYTYVNETDRVCLGVERFAICRDQINFYVLNSSTEFPRHCFPLQETRESRPG